MLFVKRLIIMKHNKKTKIVLVHGLWDDGFFFRHFVKDLSSQGYECFTPSLKPADARSGLIDLSKKLKAYINSNLKKNEKFVIIGFSMGALISRYYLQELNGSKRVKAFFSIAGPHSGTLMAYFYPGQGTKDMRLYSPFVRRLKSTAKRLKKLRLYSYWTPFDMLIFPSYCSIWKEAKNTVVWCLFHCLMLRNKALIKDISRRLKKI